MIQFSQHKLHYNYNRTITCNILKKEEYKKKKKSSAHEYKKDIQMAAFSWKLICNSYKDDNNVQMTAKTSSQDKTLFRIIWIKMNSKENQAKGRQGTLQHHSVTLEFSSAASNPVHRGARK